MRVSYPVSRVITEQRDKIGGPYTQMDHKEAEMIPKFAYMELDFVDVVSHKRVIAKPDTHLASARKGDELPKKAAVSVSLLP
jgi:hypothetical protein